LSLLASGGIIGQVQAQKENPCYADGYKHGQIKIFSDKTYFNKCGGEPSPLLDEDNTYYKGFINGCLAAEGNNTIGDCENASTSSPGKPTIPTSESDICKINGDWIPCVIDND
jgi:hypothetical protein